MKDKYFDRRNVSILYFCYNFVELIPFFAFYFLDQPHDCFVCFGKIPD